MEAVLVLSRRYARYEQGKAILRSVFLFGSAIWMATDRVLSVPEWAICIVFLSGFLEVMPLLSGLLSRRLQP